jgi:hypothetical protein
MPGHSGPLAVNILLRKALIPQALLLFALTVTTPIPFSNSLCSLSAVRVGTGKTTVGLALVPILKECVVMESDILWGMVPATPEDNYRSYRNLWLCVANNIGQAGRPVVLCGTALPEQFEDCPERRYFSTLHNLAIVCDDDLLVERLRSRPAWRQTHSVEFVEDMLQFNGWIKANAHMTSPPMTLCDTSQRTIAETVAYVAHWIRERL